MIKYDILSSKNNIRMNQILSMMNILFILVIQVSFIAILKQNIQAYGFSLNSFSDLMMKIVLSILTLVTIESDIR